MAVLDHTIEDKRIVKVDPIELKQEKRKEGVDIVMHFVIQLPRLKTPKMDKLQLKEKMKNNIFFQWLILFSLGRFERKTKESNFVIKEMKRYITFSNVVNSALLVLNERLRKEREKSKKDEKAVTKGETSGEGTYQSLSKGKEDSMEIEDEDRREDNMTNEKVGSIKNDRK